MKGDGWKERHLYRRVRNLIQPRWSLGRVFTVMLDVFPVLKENSGKFILLFCFLLKKLLWLYKTGKGKWWQCEGVSLACSTTGLHAASLGIKQLSGTPSFPNVGFSGWMILLKGMWTRVKRSGSDQVLLHTTKHETSTLQWNDLDGGHLLLIDLQPLKRGPPVRRGPLPWVTPMQHLYIQELWIEAFCPTIETHSLAPMASEVKERSLLLSELRLQLRPKRNGTRMLREPIYLLWNDIGVSTGDDKCDVNIHYRERKYPEMTTCNYAQNKDRRWIWCDTGLKNGSLFHNHLNIAHLFAFQMRHATTSKRLITSAKHAWNHETYF